MGVFSKLGFEKLTESVLGKCGSSGKAFCYGSIFCGFSYFPIGLGGGFYAYARTKNPRKSPYQWINPKNVTSIYKKYLTRNNTAELRFYFILKSSISPLPSLS